MLTLNNFFCGTGGMASGALQAGVDIVRAYDINKYAIKSYNHNIKDVAIHQDISLLKGSDISYADIWSFGFPCTDISVANAKGKERGMLQGESSGLFWDIMRLLDEVEQKPKYLVAENVEALKPLLGIIEKEFNKRGYSFHARLYNSKHWSVPQNRPRYIMVGALDNVQYSLPEEDKTSVVPMLPYLDELDDIPVKCYYSDEFVKEYYVPKECTPKLGELCQVGSLNGKGWLDILKRVYDGNVGLAPTFTTCQGGHRQAKILDPRSGRVRRLTAKEYGRMQGFDVDGNFEIVVSDAQAYTQFGNTITVGLARAIFESIVIAEGKL